MSFYQYRWESADLSSSNVYNTFGSTATLDDFIYPPFVSAELLKRMTPHYLFRRYTGKIVDYGKGKGDVAVYRKDITPLKQRWTALAEFDSLYNTTGASKKWAVQVTERGLGFPYTDRLNILAYDNPIAMLENHVGIAMQSNVDVDLLEGAYGFLDTVFISLQTGGAHSLLLVQGSYALDNTTSANGTKAQKTGTKTFGVSAVGDTVAVTKGTFADNDATNGAMIGGTGYYKDTPTIADFKYIKTWLESKRCPKIGGHYVAIINSAMLYYLMSDSEFKNVVAYSLADRFVEGEIGTVFGFVFVVDDSQAIDDAFYITADATSPSVAIILGADAVREAVALPEQIRRDTPLDAGRFNRTAILTYRAEAPVWFYGDFSDATAEIRGCIYLGKYLA